MEAIEKQIIELKTKATSALILADESRKAARHYDQVAMKIKSEIDELERLMKKETQ